MENNHPIWVEKMLDLYQSGVAHAFIIHFNVNDYASPINPINSIEYLTRIFASREIVVVYSLDKGIEFASDEQKKEALDLLKVDQKSNDPMLAALQSIDSSEPTELPSNPAAALPILDKLLIGEKKVKVNDKIKIEKKKTAIIIDGAELIIPPSDLATMSPADRAALATIRRWGRDSQYIDAGNPIFLITNNLSAIHPELRAASSRFETLEVPLPDSPTRALFVEKWLDERENKIDKNGLTIQGIANATAGLSLLHIEDTLLRADSRGKLTNDLIWSRKESIIRSEFGDVLEVIEPRMSFDDIGGLEMIKNFFQRSVINPIREGRKQRVPMGILMTGPAGTGKSIMAEAVATESQVNAVKLRIGGQIASKWQGEGERNLEKALTAIRGLAPSIVFIDEIDQAMGRGSGSGGNQQDQRIFQRLLEFMSDESHRGEVVFLAATNRPDLMDAALKRPGRFDKKIPFPVPDIFERKAIFQVMSKKFLDYDLEIGDNAEILKETDGYTGAEIVAISVKAAELMEDFELSPDDALRKAVSKISASTSDIEFMTMLAIQECNDRDLLPAKYQDMFDDRTELESKIEQGQRKGYRKSREL